MPKPPENNPIEDISNLGDICTDYKLGDDVELVTVDELMLMLETNILHKKTKPDR